MPTAPTAARTLCPCGGIRTDGCCNKCDRGHRRASTWVSDPRYRSRRWQRIAARQLRVAPLCAECQRQGVTKAASACDHVTPHRGDDDAFWHGERQSLCASCHGRKSASERMTVESAGGG